GLILKVPILYAAFKEFAKHALCQESTIFLEACRDYKNSTPWKGLEEGNKDQEPEEVRY
ncbi:unnamed protein product, partial [Chrysoparadoxa australica]